ASTISFPISRRTETITIQRRFIPAIKDYSFLKIKARIQKRIERSQQEEILVLEDEEEEDDEEKPWYYELARYCQDQSY
ncbi:hypothetical protein, partial [Klebsiella pneumoniae]|uniref:hypothetical protein n=1 Tax=Klebsiella pneumoniae TaxID=573 RepID=UPI0024DE2FF5